MKISSFIFFLDNGDVSVGYEGVCEYDDDYLLKKRGRTFCVVCEEHLNKSSIAGLRPFQNCRQVL